MNMRQSPEQPWSAGGPSERWSALIDGEVDQAGLDDALRHWREDPAGAAAWHEYHVIGDVLRSEDLTPGADDRAFLQRLQARLAQEPVVLAPAALETEPRLRRWSVPVGIAAGLALVVSTVWVSRGGAEPEGAALALAEAPVAAGSVSGGASAAPRLLRDATLDRYLAAHKQFQSANGLGPATGFIRSATHDPAAR